MHVRQLHAGDAEAFHTVRLEGLLHHPEAFGADHDQEAAMSPAAVAGRLTGSCVWGGFDGAGVLQGVIGLERDRSAKSRHIATIWGMYVRPPARGTGLARRLLDTAIADGLREAMSIRLSVAATNAAAYRLYRRAGFTDWALDRAALCLEGRFHDEILMRLDRDGGAGGGVADGALARNAVTAELSVSDWQASLRFYRDILGFRVEYQRPEEGFAFLRLGAAQLMIDQIGLGRDFDTPDSHPFGRGLNLQIEVADVGALAEGLAARGIPLRLPMEEKWYRKGDKQVGNRQFLVADPDGYLLRFFEDLGLRPLE